MYIGSDHLLSAWVPCEFVLQGWSISILFAMIGLHFLLLRDSRDLLKYVSIRLVFNLFILFRIDCNLPFPALFLVDPSSTPRS